MALMMFYASKNDEEYKIFAKKLGYDYYFTDNVYQFLRYAKEIRPEIVLMNFEKKSRTENALKNTSVTIICHIIYLISTFVCRTVFTKVLGAEYLGINGLFTNETDEHFTIVELNFSLLDGEGNKVGDAYAECDGLNPGQT